MPQWDTVEDTLTTHVTSVKEDVMTGVSFMIPFVTVGGVFLALGYVAASSDVPTAAGAAEPAGSLQWMLARIGVAGLTFMVPILGAYVAYAIADRPGLAPGFLLSYLIQQRDVLVTTADAVGLHVDAANMGAGYLGALVTGLLVGHVTRWLMRRDVPSAIEPLVPVFIVPILTTAVLAPVVFVLGIPLAVANVTLTTSLATLSGPTAVLVGAVLGSMVAFDLGGPVNKVAYVLAVGSVTEFVYGPMAAVMVAGMTPPLGLALSHALAEEKYTLDVETHAKRAVPMGLSFVTEGALPYAVEDPLRVIPSAMAGSAVAAAAVMGLGVTMPAPHGGLFVVLLANRPLVFLGCLGLGTAVTAAVATVLKSPVSEDNTASIDPTGSQRLDRPDAPD